MNERKSTVDGPRLVALLIKQRDLYQQLQELSERQRGLISGDRPEQLLTILQDRQSLIAALTRLNEQLAPFRRDWERIFPQLPDESRTRTTDLLQEINDLLRVILKTDAEDSALLSARKQAAARELGGVSDTQSVNSAYARQTGATGPASAADMTG